MAHTSGSPKLGVAMNSKRGRRVLFALALVMVISGVALYVGAKKTHDIPFVAAEWRSHPASNRWAMNNVRYHMRAGAAAAARSCKTGTEVIALLGNPDGSGDYVSSPSDDKTPSYSHIYDLGMLPQLVEFWEMRATRCPFEGRGDREPSLRDALPPQAPPSIRM